MILRTSFAQVDFNQTPEGASCYHNQHAYGFGFSTTAKVVEYDSECRKRNFMLSVVGVSVVCALCSTQTAPDYGTAGYTFSS